MDSIHWAFEKMHLNPYIVYASDLNVSGAKSELLANLCKKLNATTYVSGPSGRDYLDKSYFNDIKIEYFQPQVENHYSCLYNLL